MQKLTLLLAVLICLLRNVSAQEEGISFLQYSEDPLQHIEILIEQPKERNNKLLIFLHGASTDKGLRSIWQISLDHWTSKGYTVAAISLPGFGGTSGLKDFCGPFTLDVLHFGIDSIKDSLGFSELGLVGFGQGSIAGLLLAAQRADIRCLVCANGGYDLLAHLVPGDPLVETLVKKDYAIEINEAAFKIRSPIEYAACIKSKLFLLHRESNPVIPEAEVLCFAEAMKNGGNACAVSVLKRTEQSDPQILSFEEILLESEQWLDDQMSAKN